ncbi:MAG: sensor histidine kinase [Bacteroidota bacterium]
MKKLLNKILNIGVKPEYQLWETHITRKLNAISLITIHNMTLAFFFFEITGYTQFIIDCICGLLALAVVFLLNQFKNYVWAAYWFYCYGFLFFISVNLKMGRDSYMLLFYFPVIISMIQTLGRSGLLKHLIILSGVCLLSIITITIGFKRHFYPVYFSDEAINDLSSFNIILCFLITMAYITAMVWESLNQENLIRKMLQEKEILLAEVFHRVKNNMNIVTSLLNLKKNMSDSPEVINALEDCRGRVYAMALVHDNIFNNTNITGLNFKDYVNNLVNEIANTFGDSEEVEITLDTDDIYLELSNAIPCGLILNELITNSFKYAQSEDKKLQVHVKLKKLKGVIELEVKDNGPGFSEEAIKNTNTLGRELIKSLSEQIGGVYSFSNNMGCIFNLKFKTVS